jgi:hypothetical protein
MCEIKLQRISYDMMKSSFQSLELLKSYLSFFSRRTFGTSCRRIFQNYYRSYIYFFHMLGNAQKSIFSFINTFQEKIVT